MNTIVINIPCVEENMYVVCIPISKDVSVILYETLDAQAAHILSNDIPNTVVKTYPASEWEDTQPIDNQ